MKNVTEFKTINIISEHIYKDIFKLPQDRKKFSYIDGKLSLPIYFYRIIGMEHNSKEEYFNELYNLDKKLRTIEGMYIKLDKRLNTSVSTDFIMKFNKIWSEIKADTNLRSMYLGANLFGAKLIKNTNNLAKDDLLKNILIECIEIYLTNSNKRTATIVKNFCIKLVYWYEIYGSECFKNLNFNKHNPKILFYGEIKKDEIIFLIMLSKLGFDIMYFNTQSDGQFDKIDINKNYSIKFEFDIKFEIEEFPKNESTISLKTNAYQAERNIENKITNENSNLIKPWQYRDYCTKAVTLKTSYEEIFSIWNLESRERSGFKIEDNTVFIPNIFAKINGVDSEISTYWTNILKIINTKKDYLLIVDKIPFSVSKIIKTEDYRNYIDGRGFLIKERIMKSKDYKIGYLKTSVQNLIIDKTNEIIEKKFLDYGNDINFKIKIISTILNLNKDVLKIMQCFDYSFFIPKVFIYDNVEDSFSIEDNITISLLNAIGIDIIIFSPSGYNNIENNIKNDLFDVHNLQEVKFELKYSKEVLREMNKLRKNKKNSFIDDFINRFR